MQNLLNGDGAINGVSFPATNNNNASPSLGSPKSSNNNSTATNSKKRKLNSTNNGSEQTQLQNNTSTSLAGMAEKEIDQMMALIKRGRVDEDEAKNEAAEQLQKLATASSSNTNTSAANLAALATAFPCTSCHKTFATEVDLKAHLIRHLTQHPFVCVSCGKGFKYEHSLNFHFKQYHSGNNANNNAGGKAEKVNSADKIKTESNGEKKRSSSDKKQSQLGNKDNEPSTTTETSTSGELSGESNNFLENSILASTLLASSKSLFAVGGLPSIYTSAANGSSSVASTGGNEKVTLIDENHNAMASTNGNGGASPFLLNAGNKMTVNGNPNLSADGSIQLRGERNLISLIEAYNVLTEQTYLFYKCQPCCIAFPNLDQLGQHLQDVHVPNNFAEQPPASSMRPTSNSSATMATTVGEDGKVLFQCDKCTAKFAQVSEFEVHSQLHRMDPQLNVGGLNNSSNNNSFYPFNLLANFGDGSTASAQSNQLADFRQMLATASKDTDFGRKFAAQLLADKKEEQFGGNGRKGDGQGGGKMLINSLHHLDLASAAAGFDSHSSSNGNRASTAAGKAKLPANDPNNNSLLYMSLLPEHGNVAAAQYLRHQAGEAAAMALNVSSGSTRGSNARQGSSKSNVSSTSSTTALTNSPTSKSTKSSSSSSPSSSTGSKGSGGYSSKQIKEPVDIFEGAGQSLPIQKFDLGDIEETAPGQFKCRFCDKTFDRVFSVHRHERVHTGFKPCICKTCGRGFSEKRNLRHHIIRFHSDGSGRELLKRKRKPKSGGSTSMVNNGAGCSGTSSNSSPARPSFQTNNIQQFSPNSLLAVAAAAAVASGSRGEETIGGGTPAVSSSMEALMASAAGGSGSAMMSSLLETQSLINAFQQQQAISGIVNNTAGPSSSSSSRRRKSKPSRKLCSDDEETNETTGAETENMVVNVDPLINEMEEEEESEQDKVSETSTADNHNQGKVGGNDDAEETEEEEEEEVDTKVDSEQTDDDDEENRHSK